MRSALSARSEGISHLFRVFCAVGWNELSFFVQGQAITNTVSRQFGPQFFALRSEIDLARTLSACKLKTVEI